MVAVLELTEITVGTTIANVIPAVCSRQLSEQNRSKYITSLLLCSRREKKDKLVMKINTSKKSGFTLVEIMIVVAIIGLLAAIAIPNFVRARKTAQANSCINNLRLIDAAAQQYLLETAGASAVTFADTQPYLGRSGGTLPTCPNAGTYSVSATVKAACSLGANGGFPHILAD